MNDFHATNFLTPASTFIINLNLVVPKFYKVCSSKSTSFSLQASDDWMWLL